MNLYILVEGKAEFKIYPSWLSCLLPELERVEEFDQVVNHNYYIFESAGIPTIIIDIDLPNAISDINSTNRYDYLLVCLDADELTVSERRGEMEQVLELQENSLGKAKPILVIQNRCIETWLLGNRNIFPRQL